MRPPWNATGKSEVTVLSFNYDDIVNLPYPHDDWNFLMKHPRMSMTSRAKIFNPFAALRGHSDAIDGTARRKLKVNREDLMEDSVAELEQAFSALLAAMDEGIHPEVRITFFVQSSNASEGVGEYATLSGTVSKLDTIKHVLHIGEKQIPLADIRKIEAV